MKQLSGAPLYGRLLALPTNNRLGWKGLSGANTVAYHLRRKKSFITWAPGANLKTFSLIICDELECLSLTSLKADLDFRFQRLI